MRRSVLLMSIVWLLGCGPKIPPLARDLPSKYEEGEIVFDARIKAAFPSGTEESQLIAELTSQGFSIQHSEHGTFATFSNKRFPVESVWHVGWEAHEGRITKIWGVYGGRGP